VVGRIGLFVFDRVGEYHRRLAAEAQEAARSEGLALELFDAENTGAKQAQDLVRFASTPAAGHPLCALVVPLADAVEDGNLESDPTFRLARRVLQKGVGWLTLNHGREGVVRALAVEFPSLPVAMVAIDNEAFGRIQAQQLRALLPGGGTVLCVRGNPFDSASQGRSAGLKAELGGGGFTLEEVDGRWDPALAESAVHKWLNSPIRRQAALDAVVCQNDEMAAAARGVLARAAGELGRPELQRTAVLGGDGLPGRGRRWVDEGTLTATVGVTLPGRPAVELLSGYWRKTAALPVVTRLAPVSHPPIANLRSLAR
jgi:ABC-type sugar transport system substrate-binding protein